MSNARVLASLTVLLGIAFSGCFGGDGPLAAEFTFTTTDNQTFSFDAGPSSGTVAEYHWDFGDGETGEGERAEHTYVYVNGDYDVTLMVLDSAGASSNKTLPVATGDRANLLPVLRLTVDQRYVTPGTEVFFDTRGSSDPDGDPVSFRWDFNYDITPQELETFINLGIQQYEAGLGVNQTNATGGGNDSAPDDVDPSDPVGTVQRLVGAEPLNGGGSSGPMYPKEPYNAAFDGRISDTSPVQFFSWDAPANYYVRIDAVDIKGDVVTGFLAMKVADDAPETYESNMTEGSIPFQGPDILDTGNPDATNQWSMVFSARYPGVIEVTVDNFTAAAGTPSLEFWVCRESFDLADCRTAPLIHDGPSGDGLNGAYFNIDAGQAFEAWVTAEDDTVSAGDISFTFMAERSYDTNPWFAHEAGLMTGHQH